jgi:hypothetical protein
MAEDDTALIDANNLNPPPWFPIFNEVHEFLDVQQYPIFHPQKSDLSCASTISNVLGSCDTLLNETNDLWIEEGILVGRIVHRSKSQHRGSSYLKYLMQLKRMFRRFDQTGLARILAIAMNSTVCEGAVITAPSRQSMDLLLARMVSCGVLCRRGIRLVRVLYEAFEVSATPGVPCTRGQRASSPSLTSLFDSWHRHSWRARISCHWP